MIEKLIVFCRFLLKNKSYKICTLILVSQAFEVSFKFPLKLSSEIVTVAMRWSCILLDCHLR